MSTHQLHATTDDPRLAGAVLSRVVGAEATRDPDRLVYVFENAPHPPERVTAADLVAGGNRLAGAFLAAGMRPGDGVGILLRNHPEFVYSLVAASKLALPCIPIDPGTRGEVLSALLTGERCSALVTADYLVADPSIAAAIRLSGVSTWVLSTPEGRAAGLDPSGEWPMLNEILAAPEVPDPGEHVTDLSDLWLRAPTSGTNGDGAVVVRYDRVPFARDLPRLLGYRPDDVVYTGTSLAHPDTLVATLLPPLTGAAHHAVISRRFTPSRLWDICIEFGATTWSSRGDMTSAAYQRPTADADRAHAVRLVVSTDTAKEHWRAFEARFGTDVIEWPEHFFHRPGDHGPDRAGRAAIDIFIRRTLAEDPEVIDVHVYSVPPPVSGGEENETVAAVVVRDRGNFDPDELFGRLTARLDGASPVDVLQVVDELPRTAGEKVQTRVLSACLTDSRSIVFRRPSPTRHSME